MYHSSQQPRMDTALVMTSRDRIQNSSLDPIHSTPGTTGCEIRRYRLSDMCDVMCRARLIVKLTAYTFSIIETKKIK